MLRFKKKWALGRSTSTLPPVNHRPLHVDIPFLFARHSHHWSAVEQSVKHFVPVIVYFFVLAHLDPTELSNNSPGQRAVRSSFLCLSCGPATFPVHHPQPILPHSQPALTMTNVLTENSSICTVVAIIIIVAVPPVSNSWKKKLPAYLGCSWTANMLAAEISRWLAEALA